MKISGPNRIQPKSVDKSKKKPAADGGAFASALNSTEEVHTSAGISGASPLTTVGALIGLQEAPTATEGRSKGLARADEMLDVLEDIRRGLLLGAIPVQNLETLARTARGQQNKTNDPVLNEILAEIELRAEVELAKLGY
ncbi:flagellar assembly protein FliX [Kordiimonas sediminis]|uniref:Flagellar assembly protein FliX n=1 Tax=Kordiimonas sediminis TaxID=1735581 RepID=A0A919AYY5_9PROT|nr:flagellar assembly protein FliX [Kordiimonas sediminis]GHF29424.1 flagellar assembly protein FliX [Kordiimonas sediminis]